MAGSEEKTFDKKNGIIFFEDIKKITNKLVAMISGLKDRVSTLENSISFDKLRVQSESFKSYGLVGTVEPHSKMHFTTSVDHMSGDDYNTSKIFIPIHWTLADGERPANFGRGECYLQSISQVESRYLTFVVFNPTDEPKRVALKVHGLEIKPIADDSFFREPPIIYVN